MFALNFHLRRYSEAAAAGGARAQAKPAAAAAAAARAPRASAAAVAAAWPAAPVAEPKSAIARWCGGLGRGLIENKHSSDVESPPPPPYVCMSIHTQCKSCSDVGSIACSQ